MASCTPVVVRSMWLRMAMLRCEVPWPDSEEKHRCQTSGRLGVLGEPRNLEGAGTCGEGRGLSSPSVLKLEPFRAA